MGFYGRVPVAFLICFLPLAPQQAEEEIPEQNPFTAAADIEMGRQFFLGHCAECHGRDGEGGRGINLASGRYRYSKSDADLLRVIKTGIPGTEMPRSRLPVKDLWKIVAYIRSLAQAGAAEQASGDPKNGEMIYQSTGCTQCHTVDSRGGNLGPDLSDIGVRRSLKFLRDSLTDPSAYIPREYAAVSVTTGGGEQATGIRLNEDDYSIQLRDMSETLRSFLKSELREVKHLKESPMPAYGEVLSEKEMEDLIAYLNSLGKRP